MSNNRQMGYGAVDAVRLAAGDPVVRHYGPSVRAWLASHVNDAEVVNDLAQETFVAAANGTGLTLPRAPVPTASPTSRRFLKRFCPEIDARTERPSLKYPLEIGVNDCVVGACLLDCPINPIYAYFTLEPVF